MSLFLNPLLMLLLLLFNACSMKKDDDFCCCWCCWLCACKLFWKWFCCCCCCRCSWIALCRWLLMFGCVVWKSGDEDDVVDGEGVGVGGGAIGDAPHVWIFSNGFLKLFVSLAALVPFVGNDPYARNILMLFSCFLYLIQMYDDNVYRQTHSISSVYSISLLLHNFFPIFAQSIIILFELEYIFALTNTRLESKIFRYMCEMFYV